MEGNLRLNTIILNRKLNGIEENLSVVSDQMDILVLEMEELSRVWESSAYADWEKELSSRVEEGERCVSQLWQVARQVREVAEGFVKTEQRNIWEATSLF